MVFVDSKDLDRYGLESWIGKSCSHYTVCAVDGFDGFAGLLYEKGDLWVCFELNKQLDIPENIKPTRESVVENKLLLGSGWKFLVFKPLILNE